MTRKSGRQVSPNATGLREHQWTELVGKVGVGIAEPLTEALDHVQSLVSGGRVDPARLRKLQASIEEARQICITAQQLTRLATRRVRVSHERVQLDAMLRDVLQHRAHEAEARGLLLPDPHGAKIRAAEVLVDASLLFSLLNTLFDWLLRYVEDSLQLSVESRTWPEHARLRCSFNARDWQKTATDPVPAVVDSLSWRLLEQIAGTLDLVFSHRIDGPAVELVMEFPRATNPGMQAVDSVDLGDQSISEPEVVPLVGCNVLIVASRRALRLQIRNAIAHLGLTIDLVSSVDEAVDFCRNGRPDALVVEQALEGGRLARLRSELFEETRQLAFIAITEDGEPFEMSDGSLDQLARVRRSALETALPSVLLFELSQGQ